MDPTRKLVVAGVIVGDGEVLISQRRADQAMPLKWEFPGGKVEFGESPTQALARELLEEIGVQVLIGPIWEVLYHQYPAFELVMLVYPCRLQPAQTPQCVEVADLRWCSPIDLLKWDILEADASLVTRLQTEGIPKLP